MKIESLKVYSYDLELLSEINLKGNALKNRSGYIVQIRDSMGRRSACDVAPLPFFSLDSLTDILETLSTLKAKLEGSFWSLKLLLSKHNILNDDVQIQSLPSLFFGLEFALLSLLMPKSSLFGPVNVNTLLTGTDDAILYKLTNSRPSESIKLKVGSRSPEEMLELLEQVEQVIPRTTKIRLDGNRFWTLDQTLFFSSNITQDRLEYFEEPLQNPEELFDLSLQSNIPIGFDESLLDKPLDFLLSIPTKKAMIIKPTLIGSLQRMNLLYQKACKHRLSFVLSSCFESGLGHLMIAHLARYLGIQTPIGLDTYHWLKEDVLLKPLTFSEGQLILPKENLLKPGLNFKNLEEVHV